MKLYPEGGAKALPWVLGALAMAAVWLFYPEKRNVNQDGPERHGWGVADPVVAANRPGKRALDYARRFEDLTPRNQAFVRENYKALLRAQESKDFQAVFERARNILALVDDYNDTKSYEHIAKNGLARIEEEKRAVLLEEKRIQTRREVELLENAGREIAALGFRDPANREAIGHLIRDIYAKDPNNHLAADWMRLAREAASAESREKQRRELATLEIKGQGLLQKARRNPASRAELYKVMDDIKMIEPNNLFVDKWKKSLLND